jgi:hypothetical protein
MFDGDSKFQFDVTVRDFHFCTLGNLGFEMKEVFASRQFQLSPLQRELQERLKQSYKQFRMWRLQAQNSTI